MDGNQKNTRKKCAAETDFMRAPNLPNYPAMRIGCTNTPAFKSKYCSKHKIHAVKSKEMKNIERKKYGGEVPEEIEDTDEESMYLLEKIIGEEGVGKNKKYRCKWQNYTETTLEPRENIPKIHVDRFKKFKGESVTTYVVEDVDCRGITYIRVK